MTRATHTLQVIFNAGDPADTIFLLQNGRVRQFIRTKKVSVGRSVKTPRDTASSDYDDSSTEGDFNSESPVRSSRRGGSQTPLKPSRSTMTLKSTGSVGRPPALTIHDSSSPAPPTPSKDRNTPIHSRKKNTPFRTTPVNRTKCNMSSSHLSHAELHDLSSSDLDSSGDEATRSAHGSVVASANKRKRKKLLRPGDIFGHFMDAEQVGEGSKRNLLDPLSAFSTADQDFAITGVKMPDILSRRGSTTTETLMRRRETAVAVTDALLLTLTFEQAEQLETIEMLHTKKKITAFSEELDKLRGPGQLFDGFRPGTIKALASRLEMQSLTRGELLAASGSNIGSLYFIRTGTMVLSQTADVVFSQRIPVEAHAWKNMNVSNRMHFKCGYRTAVDYLGEECIGDTDGTKRWFGTWRAASDLVELFVADVDMMIGLCGNDLVERLARRHTQQVQDVRTEVTSQIRMRIAKASSSSSSSGGASKDFSNSVLPRALPISANVFELGVRMMDNMRVVRDTTHFTSNKNKRQLSSQEKRRRWRASVLAGQSKIHNAVNLAMLTTSASTGSLSRGCSPPKDHTRSGSPNSGGATRSMSPQLIPGRRFSLLSRLEERKLEDSTLLQQGACKGDFSVKDDSGSLVNVHYVRKQRQ